MVFDDRRCINFVMLRIISCVLRVAKLFGDWQCASKLLEMVEENWLINIPGLYEKGNVDYKILELI